MSSASSTQLTNKGRLAKRVVRAFVGARGVDCITHVDTPEKSRALRAAGTDFVFQYLGNTTAAGVEAILAADLAFLPVTFSNRFDGDATVRECESLDLPKGCTVFLDVENDAAMPPLVLIAKINAWADRVIRASYEPGMYVGPGCPLTSEELYALSVVRYWHCGAKILDRNNRYAEPECGWCLYQLYPSIVWGGVPVDMDFVQKDFHGRLPAWVVRDDAGAIRNALAHTDTVESDGESNADDTAPSAPVNVAGWIASSVANENEETLKGDAE